MDFFTPSVKQVSEFFKYLYQNLNRPPSTIDGYGTAIVEGCAIRTHREMIACDQIETAILMKQMKIISQDITEKSLSEDDIMHYKILTENKPSPVIKKLKR